MIYKNKKKNSYERNLANNIMADTEEEEREEDCFPFLFLFWVLCGWGTWALCKRQQTELCG